VLRRGSSRNIRHGGHRIATNVSERTALAAMQPVALYKRCASGRNLPRSPRWMDEDPEPGRYKCPPIGAGLGPGGHVSAIRAPDSGL
jgi:hypothetical protein